MGINSQERLLILTSFLNNVFNVNCHFENVTDNKYIFSFLIHGKIVKCIVYINAYYFTCDDERFMNETCWKIAYYFEQRIKEQ